jgi:uncharacterized protein (TIGR02246 family)
MTSPLTDDSAVRDVAARFVSAWNRHTMAELADIFTPDADFVNVIGMRMRGAGQVVQVHEALHESRMLGTTLASDDLTVRYLSPSVAVVHDTWTLTGDPGAPGWTIGDQRRGILVHVMQKTSAGWRIAASQNTDILDLPNT